MINNLHTNQRLLVLALQKRGATFQIIDKDDELLSIHYKNKKELLLDRFSSKAPYHMVKVSADKHLSKTILTNNGIEVPCGQVFTGNNIEQALNYAKDKYPVVLKPNWGSHGNYVQVDIRNSEFLESSIWQFAANLSKDEPFIIEKFYPWHEHRVFITSLGEFAVVKREPASIIGNGKNTIEQLAQRESKRRIELKQQEPTSLCPIVIDREVHRTLLFQNLNIQSIPAKGKKIFLRKESNLAKGGMAIDMTDDIHPSVLAIAKKALASFPGLPCLGLDLLCEDITILLNNKNYVIIEANSSPGLAMHTYPSIGKSRNVADMWVNIMFPNFFN